MTKRVSVAGGVYFERCVQPMWDAAYGSGGRAAAAITSLVEEVALHTYVAPRYHADVEGLASRSGFVLHAFPANDPVFFDYFHPLSIPEIWPSHDRLRRNPPLSVSDEAVVRFGMLEGDAVVDADRAVYDPQSAFGVPAFHANGSKANHLALVLNMHEARTLTGLREQSAILDSLLNQGGAECVVLKQGSGGALVATAHERQPVPAFATPHVFKIGSGDVFTGVFAALWGGRGMNPVEAARLASRATAHYVSSRVLPSPTPSELLQLALPEVSSGGGTVYIAAPFFDIGERWVVEEIRRQLLGAGARVFSPVHDVGRGPADVVARADLRGLEGADVVLAVVSGKDPGTLFEVGYARRLGKPVVALAQEVRAEDLKMVEGSGCIVVDDFSTAIYKAVWALPK